MPLWGGDVVMSIAENLQNVNETIATACAKVNRNADDVTLIAFDLLRNADVVNRQVVPIIKIVLPVAFANGYV